MTLGMVRTTQRAPTASHDLHFLWLHMAGPQSWKLLPEPGGTDIPRSPLLAAMRLSSVAPRHLLVDCQQASCLMMKNCRSAPSFKMITQMLRVVGSGPRMVVMTRFN